MEGSEELYMAHVVDVVNTTLGILKDLQKLVRQRKACGTNKLVQNTSPKTKSVN